MLMFRGCSSLTVLYLVWLALNTGFSWASRFGLLHGSLFLGCWGRFNMRTKTDHESARVEVEWPDLAHVSPSKPSLFELFT